MDFDTGKSHLNDEAVDAQPNALFCEAELEHFPMDLQSDEHTNSNPYGSWYPLLDTFMATDTYWTPPGPPAISNAAQSVLLSNSYSSNSQQVSISLSCFS